MIVLGDSDGVRLEHAVELFKLLGGGVMGDLQGMPKSQLAILPGTAHFVPPGCGLLDRADWLLDLILCVPKTSSTSHDQAVFVD